MLKKFENLILKSEKSHEQKLLFEYFAKQINLILNADTLYILYFQEKERFLIHKPWEHL